MLSKDQKLSVKYAVIYTDGGQRVRNEISGAGLGIHGYIFDKLETVRIAGVPALVTPQGYVPKPTGAQLKDDSYNPEYKKWDLKLNLKDSKIAKDDTGITLVDSWIGGRIGTAQHRELLAFITVIENEYFDAENYYIQSDSEYLCRGYNKEMAKWKERGWKLASGGEVKNLDLWKRIDEIKEKLGDKIDLRWVKAHNGDLGNESADRNATFGVAAGINDHDTPVWVGASIHDSDYWDPEKLIPAPLQTKWCYTLTATERRVTEIDGEQYSHFFVGDHNKNKDDIELLGKKMSDAGFGLVLYKGDIPCIDTVSKYHEEYMWEHDCKMYQYDVINMVNLAHLNMPKVSWEMKRIPMECTFWGSHHDDLISTKDVLISKMIRPPKLSYRILDEEDALNQVLFSYLEKAGRDVKHASNFVSREVIINDVTEKFYTTEVKKDGSAGATKMTKFYDNVTTAFDLEIDHPCGEGKVKVNFARGISVPNRNLMNKLCPDNPKVSVVAWGFCKKAFKYGLIIETDTSIALWAAVYRNMRVLVD